VADYLRSRNLIFASILLIFLLFEISSAGSVAAEVQNVAVQQAYQNSSWALGVVAPEGAGLQLGGNLRWEEVSNLTALVVLPNISAPQRMVYVVMSVMTSDGAVLQAAAGTYPNDTGWLAYSWFIPSAQSVTLTYTWVLNASVPRMAPDSRASISIFLRDGGWKLKIEDVDTGSSVEHSFPAGIATSLESGDQEVFALESYTKEAATFQYMGNLTLLSLTANGQRVTSGFYSYSDWNIGRNPVFVVGSSGSSVPAFISLESGTNGSIVWSYNTQWTGDVYGGATILLSVVAMLGVTCAVIGGVILFTRKPKAKSESRLKGD
jgi:hypothetical protein